MSAAAHVYQSVKTLNAAKKAGAKHRATTQAAARALSIVPSPCDDLFAATRLNAIAIVPETALLAMQETCKRWLFIPETQAPTERR